MKATLFFDANGYPSRSLLGLLNFFSVLHDGTIQGICKSVQNAWCLHGMLRAEISSEYSNKLEANSKLASILRSLGLIESIHCPMEKSHYEHALLLGATVTAVRKRLAFLQKEWERGVRFKTLFLLGSERDLIPEKEGPDVLFNPENTELPFDARNVKEEVPANEIEMMELIYRQPKFPWKDVITIFSVPTSGRANTRDTVRRWLECYDVCHEDSVIAVSSQPFVSFQQKIVESELLRRRLQCSTAGIGGSSVLFPVKLYLDNIAKIIYELNRELDS